MGYPIDPFDFHRASLGLTQRGNTVGQRGSPREDKTRNDDVTQHRGTLRN